MCIDVLFEHIATDAQGEERLSDYAISPFRAYLPSRKGVKKAIKRNRLKVNGENSTTGYLVKEGDVLTLHEEPVPKAEYHIDLNVQYEDDDLAVVIKPAGLIVSGNQFRTLYNALGRLSRSSADDALTWPKPVHRLDHATSGLVLVAKTHSCLIDLSRQFEERTVQKEYHAVVMGDPGQEGSWASPIDRKEAFTEYERIDKVPSLRSGELSLIKVRPKTGRTHQIRIHCAENGCPILGDKVYGEEGNVLKGKGLFLTATALEFVDMSGQKRRVEVEKPSKFGARMTREKNRWLRLRNE